MKKVLLVFPGLSSNANEGARHRLNSFIDEYTNLGYNVDVLAFCQLGAFKQARSIRNGRINWYKFPYILPISMSIVLSYISLGYMSIILSLFSYIKRYNIIQMELYNIKPFWASSKPVYVTDIHGDSYHEYVEDKEHYKCWFARLLLKIQKRNLKKSDFCIYVSEKLKEQIEINTKQKSPKAFIVSCGVDINRFINASKDQSMDPLLRDRIVLGYCGGFQRWQNFDKIIELVIKLREIDHRFFLLAYSNSDPTPFAESLEKLGYENYKLLSLSSHQVPSYLKYFDVGFLIRDNWILNIVSSPTKICEYLAAGVPVVCTASSGDYYRSVYHQKTGYILSKLDINDSQQLAHLSEFIVSVHKNKEAFRKNCQTEVLSRSFYTDFEKLEFCKK